MPLSEETDGGSFSLRPSVVLAKELHLRCAGAGDAERERERVGQYSQRFPSELSGTVESKQPDRCVSYVFKPLLESLGKSFIGTAAVTAKNIVRSYLR